ncbi:MAG: WD40 repeat domain-containing protein, partial [Candidatus Rokuibacteriota bacterium]
LPGECMDALREKLPSSAFVELAPMSPEEGAALLDLWLAEARRTLRPNQRRNLLDSFAREGLPLHLKVGFEEARRWRSFDGLPEGADGVPGLASDVPSVLRDLFWRLSLPAQHGSVMVSRSLGYLAAGRDGLSEDELVDVLSADAEVMRDFRDRSPASPRTERLPDIVWSRLYVDLAPYLSRRDAGGAETLGFYHRQVGEVVAADFLAGASAEARHRRLAAYFGAQPLENREGESRSWNRRKLVELPFQQARSSLDELEQTLTGLPFLEAKITALGQDALMADFEPAERLRPLQDALRLGAHALARRPAELLSQLGARLTREDSALLDRILGKGGAPGTWLRPYASWLTKAGGPLRETFTGMVIANDVLCTPDGRLAICSDDSARLWIFDLRSGTLRRRFDPPGREWFTAAAMHPRRSLAVFGADKGTIWWIDVPSGELVEKREGEASSTAGLAFVDDGARVVAVHENGAIVLHDTPPAKGRRRFDTGTELGALAVSPDRWYLGAGSQVRVWDPGAGAEVAAIHGQGDKVSALALSADGQSLAAGYGDGNVELIALDGRTPARLLRGHREQPTRNNVTGLAFTHDDTRLVSVAWDEVIRVWDRASGHQVASLPGHSMAIYGLALVPGTELALTTSKDSTMRVWDLARATEMETGLRHHAAVDALALARGTAVSGSRDRILCLWDLESGQPMRRWSAHEGKEPHEGWIMAAGLDAAKGTIHSAGRDGTLRTWRLADGAAAGVVRGDWENGAALAISATGSVLVVVDSDYTNRPLAVWPLHGKEKRGLVRPKLFGSTIGLAPNGRTAVVCDLNGGFVVVDVAKRKVIWSRARPMTRSRRYFTTAAVTDDGAVALLGGAGGALEAWDLVARKRRWVSRAHSDDLGAVAITPDGRLGCSGGWDRLLQVVDLRDGRPIASFTSDDSWSSCAFADDNRTIVAADERGAVHFLRLEGRDGVGTPLEVEA